MLRVELSNYRTALDARRLAVVSEDNMGFYTLCRVDFAATEECDAGLGRYSVDVSRARNEAGMRLRAFV